MKPLSRWLIPILALLGLAAVAYFWWQSQTPPLTPIPPGQAVVASPVAPTTTPAAPEPTPMPTPVGPQYPIEALQTEIAASQPEPLPPLANADAPIKDALLEWLGRPSVLTFLQVDGFVRRVVVTVDNLSRGHAAARLWPVVPTADRFQVTQQGDTTVLAESNAARYRPFVQFASGLNTAKAATFYAKWYPLFQSAYEELGYPGKYFNDRLVQVIDQMLATPELNGPVKLVLTEVKGSVPTIRPWVRYEYADAALEARPAGQKMLMRMGTENSRVLKAKLKEFRQLIGPRTAP
ncbi:DUF3014 domain-containing protein [Rhodoferax sp. PAMC 29310]|uniref:DUF3014 domain-containing protein n=1 Tax=Rhodoferax sp. PAMC 29310 TaxID=2822760 RepID=UPI001B331344|nr:DUF3014 domain-containing protein [Rhodoferax sp. PAMC 29310]